MRVFGRTLIDGYHPFPLEPPSGPVNEFANLLRILKQVNVIDVRSEDCGGHKKSGIGFEHAADFNKQGLGILNVFENFPANSGIERRGIETQSICRVLQRKFNALGLGGSKGKTSGKVD